MDTRPPLNTQILFCCWIDDGSRCYWTDIEIGKYRGEKTRGDGLVIETDVDDWSPCTHWMSLPDYPEDRLQRNAPAYERSAMAESIAAQIEAGGMGPEWNENRCN